MIRPQNPYTRQPGNEDFRDGWDACQAANDKGKCECHGIKLKQGLCPVIWLNQMTIDHEYEVNETDVVRLSEALRLIDGAFGVEDKK